MKTKIEYTFTNLEGTGCFVKKQKVCCTNYNTAKDDVLKYDNVYVNVNILKSLKYLKQNASI